MSDEFKLEELAGKGKRIEEYKMFDDTKTLHAFVDMMSHTPQGRPEPAMAPYQDLPLKTRGIIAAAHAFAKAEFSRTGGNRQARRIVADAAMGVRELENVGHQGVLTAPEGMTPALQARFEKVILDRHQHMDFNELRYMAGAAMIIHQQHQRRQAEKSEIIDALEDSYDHGKTINDKLRYPLNQVGEQVYADWQRHQQGAHKHINDSPTSRRALFNHLTGMEKASRRSPATMLTERIGALAQFVQGYPSKEETKAARPAVLDKLTQGAPLRRPDWKVFTASLERSPIETIAQNDEPLGPLMKSVCEQDNAPFQLRKMASHYVKAHETFDAAKPLPKADILAQLSKHTDKLTSEDKTRLAVWEADSDRIAGKDLTLMAVRLIDTMGPHAHKGKTRKIATAALSGQVHAQNEQTKSKTRDTAR